MCGRTATMSVKFHFKKVEKTEQSNPSRHIHTRDTNDKSKNLCGRKWKYNKISKCYFLLKISK